MLICGMSNPDDRARRDSFIRQMFQWKRELRRSVGVVFLFVYYSPYIIAMCVAAYAILVGAEQIALSRTQGYQIMSAVFYVFMAAVAYIWIDWPWQK